MAKIELTALKPFMDKNDTKVSYKKGDKLATDEVERINDLIKRGLCEVSALDVADKRDKKVEK
jgi:hypothetical protein